MTDNRDLVKGVDVLIVGGGIAGGAMATVMAREGASVLVLERQTEYRDHVRGELVWPWGAQVARDLGIEQVLLGAGALLVPWLDEHDEAADAPTRLEVGSAVAGIAGSLNLAHPVACAALVGAASSFGADVAFGVRDVRLTVGSRPVVSWAGHDGSRREATAGIVVGADGRRSSVRSQAGVSLEVDAPAHLVAGMYAEGIEGLDEEVNLYAREGDIAFIAFPQREGRARLYLCFPAEQRSRFVGRNAAEEFMAATRLACLNGAAWHAARPAGPCGTFPAEDSRTALPLAEGVVLIGDAAGYDNPLLGQGLSMALKDVEDVSRTLLGGGDRASGIADYATTRAVRQRLANLATALEVWVNDGFHVQGPGLRAARYQHIAADDVLSALQASTFAGFDSLPPDLTAEGLVARLEAHA